METDRSSNHIDPGRETACHPESWHLQRSDEASMQACEHAGCAAVHGDPGAGSSPLICIDQGSSGQWFQGRLRTITPTLVADTFVSH